MILEFRGKNRWLSNFHECEIPYLDRVFPTTEHAYQAAKSFKPEEWDEILKCAKAREAMHLGRTFVIEDEKYWHAHRKFLVMHQVNFLKYTHHHDLREKLLATGDEHLEEGNTWGDDVWGTVNRVGANHLGEILMHIRTMLRLGITI